MLRYLLVMILVNLFLLFSQVCVTCILFFFFSSRRRHTRSDRDWSSDVCSSDLGATQTSTKGSDVTTVNSKVFDESGRQPTRTSRAVEFTYFLLRVVSGFLFFQTDRKSVV